MAPRRTAGASSPSSSTPPPGRPASGRGLTAWLRTREGKITAGAGAALLVIVLALRKGAGQGGGEAGGGFLPSAIQPSFDGTLQGQLDQLSGQGGTLAELIGVTTDLSGGVRDLTDLLEAQNPLPPTSGGLTATGVSPTTVMLQWHPVAGATGWEVRRDAGPWQSVVAPYGRLEVPAPADRRPHSYEVRPVLASGARGNPVSATARTISQSEFVANLRRLAGGS